jgi:NTE family protein
VSLSTQNVTLAETLAGRRVGLVLCARFFGFYGHLGLLQALAERGVRPAAYAGTSAGALVAAFAASGMPLDQMAATILPVRLRDYWDPAGPSTWRGLPAPGLLRGERFHELLRRALPVHTFAACPSPILVEAVNISRGELEILRDGDLPRAVWASCAYPGLFQPVRIGGDCYWDGGLVNKAPIGALAELPLDALLIHWQPSSSLRSPLPSSFTPLGLLRGLTRGIAVARRETARLQARHVIARGMPVYVLTPELPGSGPTSMHLGAEVASAARAAALEALDRPAQHAVLDDRADRLR